MPAKKRKRTGASTGCSTEDDVQAPRVDVTDQAKTRVSHDETEALNAWSEKMFGHRFNRPTLLIEAFTHASATGRPSHRRKKRSNERLEFLGDRVVGLAVAHLLIESHPDEDEGALTKRHDALVRRETLAEIAQTLEFGDKLALGTGQTGDGSLENPAILADLCEAVLGALYLDAGYDAVMPFIEHHWRPIIERMEEPPRDGKTALQEWAQARALPLPTYSVIERTGPAHAPTFCVSVVIDSAGSASGQGSSKRAAETEAAIKLLDRLSARKAKVGE